MTQIFVPYGVLKICQTLFSPGKGHYCQIIVVPFSFRLNVTGFVQPNFDDFVNSLYLVFQLLTTEDWHNILYISVGAYTVVDRTNGLYTILFFVVAIVLGNRILFISQSSL